MNGFMSGNLGLAKTFWLFNSIGGFIVFYGVNIMGWYLLGVLLEKDIEVMTALGLMAGAIISAIVYGIIVSIALWNSSKKYKGFQTWAGLARIYVVGSVFNLMGTIVYFMRFASSVLHG